MHPRSFLHSSSAIAEMARSYARGRATAPYYISGAYIDDILVKGGRLRKPVDIATTLRPLREDAGQARPGDCRASGEADKAIRS